VREGGWWRVTRLQMEKQNLKAGESVLTATDGPPRESLRSQTPRRCCASLLLPSLLTRLVGPAFVLAAHKELHKLDQFVIKPEKLQLVFRCFTALVIKALSIRNGLN
jgi:hypothetical protein